MKGRFIRNRPEPWSAEIRRDAKPQKFRRFP